MHEKQKDMIRPIYDAVVMLTWSDWFKELRSNRYNYATRFARNNKVIFVQPDLKQQSYRLLKTEFDNITVLSIYENYGRMQTELINKALVELSILRPLLWIYNTNFTEFLASRYTPLIVYHATEDYLGSDSPIHFEKGSTFRYNYQVTLDHTDLLLSVSAGVEEGILKNTNYNGTHQVITNGADYHFYKPTEKMMEHIVNDDSKIAFYQGNITDKLDFELLAHLASRLPDWSFLFCGKVASELHGWTKLLEHKNVKYLGCLNNEELRKIAWSATVGLIPFEKNDWLVKRSFPLKTFEYLSCGLQVISTPINSLMPFSDVINFAETPEEFVHAFTQARIDKSNKDKLTRRLAQASLQDYDIKFDQALEWIESAYNYKTNTAHQDPKLNILILYDKNSLDDVTTREELSSFYLHSENHIYYATATENSKCNLNLADFDVVVLHYTIKPSTSGDISSLSRDFANAIEAFVGYKILYLHDDHRITDFVSGFIEKLGVHHVYTCLPECSINKICAKSRYPSVYFEQVPARYVPSTSSTNKDFISLESREFTVAYRGKALPSCNGIPGQDNLNLAIQMKTICKEHDIPESIELDESKRIYNEDWHDILRNTCSILGVESVSDVFESISSGTVLILFEGEYPNILIPELHYIPLKKDYSNINSVLKSITDLELLERIRRRTYCDIIQSGKHGYSGLISRFDESLKKSNVRSRNLSFFTQHIINRSSEIINTGKPSSLLTRFPQLKNLKKIYLSAITYISPVAKHLIPPHYRLVIKKFLLIEE